MKFDSTEQELRVRLAHRVGAKFSQYKSLCEWLDCYQYILPSERILDWDLIFQCATHARTSSDSFKFYLLQTTAESTLSKIEQVKLCQLIHEFGIYHIAPDLH